MSYISIIFFYLTVQNPVVPSIIAGFVGNDLVTYFSFKENKGKLPSWLIKEKNSPLWFVWVMGELWWWWGSGSGGGGVVVP